mmetsp:Transcript_19354/g.44561  ORF Transcript_19354/g.44561 Transcript_19354/m.44561 type:complete len:838 (-) Transcript_19354:80-2593(-)|eukprot:CAMPEP_0204356630 /NCGR_PEP_ID=MMETSP0469-20131031/35082_1 /ASSEMBLY_ACC=CAM_ASM_000384 /TAXON_ID=2969 /ORGANISM="Oxyrrhis marina" /LENGTH=837 /DNA_ID=CAMNT_0051344119 /DNA_START=138 /DNA_END=2651 /DNA_ORIENTATION=+
MTEQGTARDMRSARSAGSRDSGLADPTAMKDVENMNQSLNAMFQDKQVFLGNVQMACRGAVAICLVVSVTLVPGLIRGEFPRAYQDITLLGMVGFWFVLTFWKDVGTTIRNAWQAIMGTLYAVGNSFIMNAIFPGGAKLADQNGYRAEVAWLDLIIAVSLIMYMNVSDRCRTFALFYIAMFMMHYMNPDSVAKFSRSFQVDWNGTGMSYLLVCLTGTGLAILFSFVPYPRFITNAAALDASNITVAICELLEQVIEIYNGTHSSSALHSKCEQAAEGINEKLKSLELATQTMFWEGFDIGQSGKRRHLMSTFHKLLKHLMDIIHGLELAAKVDDLADDGLLRQLSAEIFELSDTMKAILVGEGSLSVFVADCELSESEARELHRRALELADESHRLSKAYTQLRVESGEPTLGLHLLEEDYFIYNMAGLAHVVSEFAVNVQTQQHKPMTDALIDTMLDVMDPEAAGKNINFIIRGVVSYMLAFVAGIYVYGYDFTIAATVALILSRFVGSALERNLGRMQGVVLGLVLPAIVMSQVPTCSGGIGTAVFLVIIFGFEAVCLYIFFSASARYAFIGMLTAAFAAQSFFQPCSAFSSHGSNSSAAYARVTATVTGILLVAIIDMALTQDRPSHVFQVQLTEGMAQLRRGFHHFFAGKEIGNPIPLATGAINSALTHALEAEHEPRYWRTPFPSKMAEVILGELQDMLSDLRILDRASHTFEGKGKGSLDVSMLFSETRKTDLFKTCIRDLFKQYDAVALFAKRCIEHESDEPNQDLLSYEHNVAAGDSLEALVEYMKDLVQYTDDVPVLDDTRCRVGVALFVISCTHVRLDSIVGAILRY